MVLDRFLMGLDEMRKHVSLARITGVDQAIRLVTEYENICGNGLDNLSFDVRPVVIRQKTWDNDTP